MTQIKVLFIEQMVNGTANLRTVLQEEPNIVIVGTVVAPIASGKQLRKSLPISSSWM